MINDNLFPDLGLADPHALVENGRVYLFCGHDQSTLTEDYCHMDKWIIISSDNLIDWQIEGEILPQDTYMTKNDQCWAGYIIKKDNKYYWYFSNRNEDTGVLVSDNVKGPFIDVLKRPLLTKDMADTHPYDPTIYTENGEYYIIFGAGQYYIAKLNDDMLSLAEKPKKLMMFDKDGSIKSHGDKSTLFKRNGYYYLCWGNDYSMSETLYGPYTYVGEFIGGGHNDVFTFKGQDYVCSEFHDINVFYRGVRINTLDFDENNHVIIPKSNTFIRPPYKHWDFNNFAGGWHFDDKEFEVKDNKMIIDLKKANSIKSAIWLGTRLASNGTLTLRLQNNSNCKSINVTIHTVDFEKIFWKKENHKVAKTFTQTIPIKSSEAKMQTYKINLKLGEYLSKEIKRIIITPLECNEGELVFDYIHLDTI